MPGARFILCSYVLLHIAFIAYQVHCGISIETSVSYLDAGWYKHLATTLYTSAPADQPPNSQYAFFPLWPLVLHGLAWMFGLTPSSIEGGLAASAIFLSTAYILGRREGRDSRLKFLFLCIVPSSWVWFSNHTESLFLMLTIIGFLSAKRGAFWPAVICGGLASITRNQGILAAVVIGLLLAQSRKEVQLRIFFAAGLCMSLPFIGWLSFLWHRTGNPLAFIAAQSFWGEHSYTAGEWFHNLIWFSPGIADRKILLYVLILVSLVMIRRKQLRLEGTYCLASLALVVMQGYNAPQVGRFSAVLFPLWFYMFDWVCAKWTGKQCLIVGLCVTALVFLSVKKFYCFYEHACWPY